MQKFICMQLIHFSKKKKLLSIYYLPGIEATLRIKQTAKTPCSHGTCNSVGGKKKKRMLINIMKEKVRALWVWIKRETNMNKFRKGLPKEMTVKLRSKG